MARVLYLSFALVVAVAGLAFYVRNKQPVILDYFFGTLETELSIAMLVALITGALLGVLAMTSSYLGLQRELRRLGRQKDNVGRELASLRDITLKDAR